MALLHKYEETNLENKRIFLANQAIYLDLKQGLFYKNNHILLFAKCTTGLQSAFAAITKYKN